MTNTLTDKEILERAIRKAIDGGLTGYWADRYKFCVEMDELEYLVDGNNIEEGKTIESLIFDHSFAKAIFGDALLQYPADDNYTCTEKLGGDYSRSDELFIWEYHLQMMVIAPNPIAYLGENL